LLWQPCRHYVTNDHGSILFVVITIRLFPHSWLSIGFVTRVALWEPLMEQELLTLPDHLSSPSVFSGVVFFLVFCVMFCRSLFVLFSLLFYFGHCIVCSYSVYVPDYSLGIFKLFWPPLSYTSLWQRVILTDIEDRISY